MQYTTIETNLDHDLLSANELRARMREIGKQHYHHRHPFHVMMHEGRLDRGQLQAWALNRYYYQSKIPVKDAIILSRSDDAGFRLAWRKRIIDHDGDATSAGGIERWLKLAEATGLELPGNKRGFGATRHPVCSQRISAPRGKAEFAGSSGFISVRNVLPGPDCVAD